MRKCFNILFCVEMGDVLLFFCDLFGFSLCLNNWDKILDIYCM